MRKKSLLSFSVFLLTISLFLLASCKKDDPARNDQDVPGNYYIQFKADGEQKVFEKDAVSAFNISDSDTLFSAVVGASLQQNNSTTNFFAVLLGAADPVVPGQSFVNISPAPSGSIEAESLVLAYNDAAGKQFGEIGDDITFFLYGVHSESKIQVTELTNEYAKGTFSGLLFDSNASGSSAARVRITEGKFYLQRVQ
jgi:hypothetical protein